MAWVALDLGAGTVVFTPGNRYAVLASVDKARSLATIEKYVAGKGFAVTYACEPPCTRNQYDIDVWLTKLPAPRSGERWVYAEGNFNGAAPWTVARTASFPVTLVATYSIANVFEAEGASGGGGVLPTPAVTASSSAAPLLIVGGIVVAAAAGAWYWKRRGRDRGRRLLRDRRPRPR